MAKIRKLNGYKYNCINGCWWLFHLGDAPDAGFMGYDDGAWKPVSVPHDWSVEYPFDPMNASGTGYLPGGIGWYRCHFFLSEEDSAKQVLLRFFGVYKHARVWLNSHYLGTHAYGYTEFSFDITPYIRKGFNVIAVRVEHSDVADSRWFTGSGIYRDVQIEISENVHFREYGVFAYTRAIQNGEAEIGIRYETEGADGARFTLIDGDKNVAAGACAEGACGEITLRVKNARLWNCDTPYLYTLRCEALSGESVTDTQSIPFGIRTAVFDADKGFFLNNESMKIKGVCVHHDGGCLGAAVPGNVWRQRLQTLKGCGCNAIRTAHNPPNPNLLELCDEMGFLVMDEAFDEWEGIKNKWWQGHNVYPPKHYGYAEDFPQWHEIDLKSMVLRDRNHPCVILWSIGNEIDYPNDPYVTPLFKEVLGNNDANKPAAERLYDDRKPDAGRLATVARELTGIVHSLDTTRLVTSALSFPELSNLTGYAEALDAAGYNYREHFYADDHRKYPDRVILGSENSHDPKCWYAVRDNDYMSAQFLWTGIDFLGECRGWPLRISQAGLIDLAGNEKPLYYQRKALWTKEPFVKIAVGKGEKERHGVWDECFVWGNASTGDKMSVSCYTNENEVELFLNGRSLGKKTLADEDGCRATWEVPFESGTLRAVTPHAEDSLSDCILTKGGKRVLHLTPDCALLPADGESVCRIALEIVNEDGALMNDTDERIRVQLLGDGELMGIENGKPDDLMPYSSCERFTYHGRLTIYVRVGTRKGELGVYANAFYSSVEGAKCELTLI